MQHSPNPPDDSTTTGESPRFDAALPLRDLPWSARPIAPDVNAKVGPAIEFDRAHRVEATAEATAETATLRHDFDLTAGFPVASGLFALGGLLERPDAAALALNGRLVPLVPDDRFGRWAPLWGELRAGANRLELTLPVGAVVGIALQTRDLMPDGNPATRAAAGGDWLVEGGRLVPAGEGASARLFDGPLFDRPRRSAELRADVNGLAGVRAARMTIVGPTFRDVRLNGRPVTDALFEPGWTDCRKRLTAVTYDVAGLLRDGANDWSITLGNGWFTSGMGWRHMGRFAGPDVPLWVAAELVVEYDGGTVTFATGTPGPAWRWRPSTILGDTIYDGEHRGPAAGEWRSARTLSPDDLGDSRDAVVGPPLAEPIRVVETLAPAGVRQLGAGRFVVDFGRNHAGACAVDVAGLPAGTRLRLRHAEIIDDHGGVDVVNLRTARAIDTLICGEPGDEARDPAGFGSTWVPRFTYHGYRYAEVAGLPGDLDAGDVARRMASRVMRTDAAPAGSFDCSSGLLNRIGSAGREGVASNLHSTLTDCPQRDERLGWTGDVQFIADLAPWHFDLRGTYRKFLLDVIDAQHADGGIPHVAPQTVVDDVSMAWADVITVLPWVMWQQYGDRAAVEVAYPAARRWLAYLDAHEADGRCEVVSFGDWVPVVETPAALVAQAWSSWTARLGGRLAVLLGRADDAARFAAAADRRAARFHADHFDEAAGRYAPHTQTAQVLSLAFGITPAHHVDSVRAALVADVRGRGDKLSVGFCGAPHLLPVLSDAGHHDLAFALLDTVGKPSLGYMIDQGATMVWERWDSDTSPPDMNSRNHFAFASMTRWLPEHAAGLRVGRAGDPVGRTRLDLHPRPTGTLTHAEARRTLPEGEARLRWDRDGDRFRVEATVPAGVEARLVWPGATPPDAIDGAERHGDAYRCAPGDVRIGGTV